MYCQGRARYGLAGFETDRCVDCMKDDLGKEMKGDQAKVEVKPVGKWVF